MLDFPPADLKDFLTLMNIFASYFFLRDIKRIYVCRKCKNLLGNEQDGYPSKLQPCGPPFARVEKHYCNHLIGSSNNVILKMYFKIILVNYVKF